MTTTTKVYVCSNHETLRDGYVSEVEAYSDHISEAVSDAMRLIDEAGFESESAGMFRDWHGGKFYQAGSKVGSDVYGYRCGFVATLAKNPSEGLIAAINAANDLLCDRLTAISKLEEADLAATEEAE